MNQIPIEHLPSAHVIEAAIVAFSDELGIDDPEDAAARICSNMHDTVDATALHELIWRAGNDATDDVVQVLRMILMSWDAHDPDGIVHHAVNAAGAKQLVISPEYLYLAAAVIAALLVIKPPKSSENRTIKIEESPDGHKKVTINEKVTYLNPKSALVALMGKILSSLTGAEDK